MTPKQNTPPFRGQARNREVIQLYQRVACLPKQSDSLIISRYRTDVQNIQTTHPYLPQRTRRRALRAVPWMDEMKTILLLAIGLFLGFYMVIFLPFLFVTWLQSFIIETREPVQCDGGEEASTPLVDAIKRDAFVADLEKRLDRSSVLQEVPLPGWFDRWVEEWNRKHSG
jgi:hypothetical protein